MKILNTIAMIIGYLVIAAGLMVGIFQEIEDNEKNN